LSQKGSDHEEGVDLLGVEVSVGCPSHLGQTGLDLEPCALARRQRADRRNSSARDEDRAGKSGLGRRNDEAAADAAELLETLQRADHVLERGDAVAQPARVLVAPAVGEVAQPRA